MPDSPSAMFQVHIQGSLEDVWHEITRTDQPIPAFFNNRMHRGPLEAGSPLAMRTGDGKWTGVVGEITEVVPHKRFAHTFKFTNYDDPPCKVIYELEPEGDGVGEVLGVDAGGKRDLHLITAPLPEVRREVRRQHVERIAGQVHHLFAVGEDAAVVLDDQRVGELGPKPHAALVGLGEQSLEDADGLVVLHVVRERLVGYDEILVAEVVMQQVTKSFGS